jgi:WD40 repeat protein
LPSGLVITASDDKTCKIWDPSLNWTLVYTYTNHTSPIYGLEFVNEFTIISGSTNGIIRIWSFNLNITNLTISTSVGIRSLKLLRNCFHLAAGLHNGDIRIYDIYTGDLITTLRGHKSNVQDLELIAHINFLASSSSDRTIRLWNLTTNTNVFNLTGHASAVYGLKLMSLGILASGSNDSHIRLWDVSSGELIRSLSNHTRTILWSVDIYRDQILISGSHDKKILLWDFNTGQLIKSIQSKLFIRALAVINVTTTTTTQAQTTCKLFLIF